jgi:hypothetical protein
MQQTHNVHLSLGIFKPDKGAKLEKQKMQACIEHIMAARTVIAFRPRQPSVVIITIYPRLRGLNNEKMVVEPTEAFGKYHGEQPEKDSQNNNEP